MTAHYDPWADSSETMLLFTSLPPVNTLVAGVTTLLQSFTPVDCTTGQSPPLAGSSRELK